MLSVVVTLLISIIVAQSAGFAEASYNALRTLTFVSAGKVLPRVVEQLRMDINPSIINAISDDDFGIWATPEGVTYVDGNSFAYVGGSLI